MLWVKSFHIIFMVAWFAGLFYMPRLFVYHAQATDVVSIERFKVMERKLYYGIMTPCMVLTLGLGLWLWGGYRIGFGAGWMHAKLAFVAALLAYHAFCYRLMGQLQVGRCSWSPKQLRALNELPTLLLVIVVMLVVFKAQFPTGAATWFLVALVVFMAASIQFYARWRRLRAERLASGA